MQGFIARKAYVKYESPVYSGSKAMAKVKVYHKYYYVNLQGQCY